MTNEKAVKAKNWINWPTVLTLTVAALVIAGMFYLLSKSDIKILQQLAKAS